MIPLGGIGIASRGIIYLLLAYLAFDIARHGSAPVQTNSTGALQELETRTGGKLLLVFLAVGFACYAGWRLFNTISGQSGAVRRISSFAVAIIYGILCIRAVVLLDGHATSGGVSSNPEPWVATIMRWPAGSVVVEAAGAVLVAAGAGLAGWGLLHRYEKHLALERISPPWEMATKVLGGFGDLARGSLIALLGIYLIEAGDTADPARAKSVDETLRGLVHHPFGAVAIGG